ncbi:MAG: EpsG family protein [Alistipes sp.]|nr:EpsG family protein [Alistipes sp.]
MLLVFYILSPFLTFLYSCTDLRKRSAQIVFVLFFGLFGYCHTFEDIRADSYRKYESFTNYAAEDFEDIYKDFQEGERKDVYESILFSTIKGFSNDPHIMMMFVGLFGGFFYMLVVKRFLNDKHCRYTWPIAILLAFMIMESNIPLMGGIRNFSAFPLFMYSLIRVLIDNRKIWIIGLLITPLFHFGYIVATIAALIIWVIKIPNVILHYLAIVICVASLFLDTSSYAGALDILMGTMDNEAIADRINNYGEEDTDIHFNKSLTTQLVRVNNQIGACFIVALLIFIHRNRAQFLSTPYIQRIYKVLLFFIVVSYALISFSVVGQRFVYIAMVLLYFLLLNIYQDNMKSGINIFIYSMPFVFSIHIMWTLYNCYCNTGLGIYFYPLPMLML